MSRCQLLAAASEILGRPIESHHLDYALRRGYVEPETRRPDGWNLYGPEAVDSLVRYMRERSRSLTSTSK